MDVVVPVGAEVEARGRQTAYNRLIITKPVLTSDVNRRTVTKQPFSTSRMMHQDP